MMQQTASVRLSIYYDPENSFLTVSCETCHAILWSAIPEQFLLTTQTVLNHCLLGHVHVEGSNEVLKY
jgi:hypothetical protein